jgi:hypothetical protein
LQDHELKTHDVDMNGMMSNGGGGGVEARRQRADDAAPPPTRGGGGGGGRWGAAAAGQAMLIDVPDADGQTALYAACAEGRF